MRRKIVAKAGRMQKRKIMPKPAKRSALLLLARKRLKDAGFSRQISEWVVKRYGARNVLELDRGAEIIRLTKGKLKQG